MAGSNPGYFSNHSQTRLTTTTATTTAPSNSSGGSGASAVVATYGANGAAPNNSRARSASAANNSSVRSKHFSLSLSVGEKQASEKGAGNGEKPSNGAAPTVHPLKSTWVFWFHQRTQRGTTSLTNYEEGIKKITAFSSVESFWSLFTHLNPPSTLQPTTDYLLFHSGVRRPVWEDPLNVEGGKWSVRLRKGVADRMWEDLILAVIGDQFEEGGEVCGCVLSVRLQEDIISVWIKDEGDLQARERIQETIRRVLTLPPSTVMDFKSHNESLQDKSHLRTNQAERSALS